MSHSFCSQPLRSQATKPYCWPLVSIGSTKSSSENVCSVLVSLNFGNTCSALPCCTSCPCMRWMMCWQQYDNSANEWLTIINASWYAWWSWRISANIATLVGQSKAVKGSSNKMIRLPVISVRAKLTRCASPPDKLVTGCDNNVPMPVHSITCSTEYRRVRLATLCLSIRARFSLTIKCGNNKACCCCHANGRCSVLTVVKHCRCSL